jgi:hypothetical protein
MAFVCVRMCGMGRGRRYAEAVVYVQWLAAAVVQWCAKQQKARARNRGLGCGWDETIVACGYDEVCEGEESGLDGWKGLIGTWRYCCCHYYGLDYYQIGLV